MLDRFLRRARVLPAALLLIVVAAAAGGRADEPVRYRFSFPQPQHRWMQVEATFTGITQPTLELRMSRSSPGRYSLHDFAKNVYDVHAFGVDRRELPISRPDSYGWNVSGHAGAVTIAYKVYGDRLDGTYLAIDETHAHVNMPPVIMWGRGFEDRRVVVSFEPPAGVSWRVATQLHAGSGPLEFTAGNLEYLMDSPAEFGPIAMRSFTVGPTTFRLSLHQDGSGGDLDGFVRDVEKIVRQEGAIYGAFPEYEPGTYTFLVDALAHASGDGMEHRNSTVITSPAALATGRSGLLETAAHEFFHCWNVERIRPKGLEPFDFERANFSGELWLAEGFTQYYGPLVLQRSGLEDLSSTARSLTALVDTVTNAPGRQLRSAEEMSLMAPFIDGGHPADRTNWSNTVISYYPFGAAIALALDLTLRVRTDNRVSLDDFMSVMWQRFGQPGGSREGYVDRPYTIDDAESVLADVSGDQRFAQEFFARYIRGHDVADYPALLARAGFAVRRRHPGRAWLGNVRLAAGGGVRVSTLVAPGWPVYAAGLEEDDEVQEVDGRRIGDDTDLNTVLGRRRPGDRVAIAFIGRSGRSKTSTVTLMEDPHLDVVPMDALSAAQKTFRDRWLGDRMEERGGR